MIKRFSVVTRAQVENGGKPYLRRDYDNGGCGRICNQVFTILMTVYLYISLRKYIHFYHMIWAAYKS